MRKPRARAGVTWTFVPDASLTPEEQQKKLEDDVYIHLSVMSSLATTMEQRFALLEERERYLPGKNKVPDDGAWILVKKPPPCEYTVPPMSIWFAVPWPSDKPERLCSHRVKIITPRGELGVYPNEYSLIENPGKYYEFIGQGMEIKFFGNEEGVPRDQLFYLRSRGVSKKDALAMLIGNIKAHGVLWMEATRETVACFGMEFPSDKRNATLSI